MKFEAPPGTHDVLAKDWPHWQRILRTVERLCRGYGYQPISTPVFEDTDLFLRTSGGGSDVVQKEMYTFEDRGKRSLTLRPEGTAPIARAYLQHGLHREPQPQKLFTIAPMYRYARPQRGRYREHWQLSVEAIGSADPAVDAELIQLYAALLGALGVTDYQLQINSIGDRQCRPRYVEELVAWLDANDARLDDETREKRKTTPLRVFDVKDEGVRAVLAEAPSIDEFLCDECREHFDAVRACLDAYGVSYEVDKRLVRGLDYYTRTTWEFIGPEEGAQSTISGGGRYDYLVEEIGGAPAEQEPVEVFFAVEDVGRRTESLRAMAKLRAEGRSADTDYAGRSLKGQLTQAQRLGAEIVVIAHERGFTVRRRGQDDVEVGNADELAL